MIDDLQRSLEQETENLRQFRLFVTESFQNPVLARIIWETNEAFTE